VSTVAATVARELLCMTTRFPVDTDMALPAQPPGRPPPFIYYRISWPLPGCSHR